MTLDATAAAAGCPYHLDATGAGTHQEAAALRALGPAARTTLPGGVDAWTVTDPRLIRWLLAHPDVSKDASQHWPDYIRGDIPQDWVLRMFVDVRNAFTAYGKEHRRLRRPLAAAFTPRRVRALIPQIEAITDSLLDNLAAAGSEDVVDLREHLTWRLPLMVVNAIFGTPDHLTDAFRDAAGAIFVTDDSAADPSRIYGLIHELIAYKTAHPGEDLSTVLIAARDAGEISDQELADSFVLIISAGHETTVNALGHGIVNLTTHRDQLALATSGAVPWDQVVEEILRHEPPVATLIMRFPTRDLHDAVSGITFKQGEPIAINFAAAGRDPHTHGDSAEAFDITRARKDHLSFGHGAHLCVGAELARIETRIALKALFTRFPHLRLAVDPADLQPFPSNVSNGYLSIPAHLGPTV
ncbi:MULTISPECIES: cytochrome P450 [unclassified Streptomyces]|uniref:cytochrome P450 family protein n=1 Tax=unclassified Streptomyces TaxID=2593676 RepID=UPI00074AC025|nr:MULTISPECIES: cytochrome P450 [unclassified Streptomyces]KUL73918.1 cytochrome [Streptomyces sp. NRRL WC-3605]KUL74365.1 cytochrome [Streptomyces sp. NRRL WC-3604]